MAMVNIFLNETGKCKRVVCGKYFDLRSDNRYTAIEGKGTFQSLMNDSKSYDAFDCPACGCQNIVGERLDRINVEDEECRISET